MLTYWTERCQQPVRSTSEDTKVFTLNVLAAALFNKIYPFEGQAEENNNRHIDDKSYQYRASLSTILGSIIQIFIFGEEGLKAWWTPKSWKGAAEAMATFRSYLQDLMKEERLHLKKGLTDHQHLVARLVRASTAEPNPNDEGLHVMMTENEIVSNLFVYAFAGNDTTAIALTNIIVHLSANPQTQDWIAEELHHHLTTSNPDSWNYDNFKKLKRCSAVIVSFVKRNYHVRQLWLTYSDGKLADMSPAFSTCKNNWPYATALEVQRWDVHNSCGNISTLLSSSSPFSP